MTSPFSRSKFEHDGNHLYFLRKTTLQSLEGDLPILIHGSRGTGKTTLLNALNWREQKNNQSLKEALKEIEGRRDYIGIYLKVPELKIGTMRKWEDTDNSSIYGYIFSYYLELVWLEELVRAVHEMSISETLKITPEREKDFVKNVVAARIIRTNSSFTPKTFLDICDLIQATRKYIEDASVYGSTLQSIYVALGGVEQIGTTGSNFCLELTKCMQPSKDGKSFKFKVCMDECESFSQKQILVVNTLIRLSKFPVLYVFSFVRKPYDFSTTLVENITNQKADFEIVNLDDIQNFPEFAEGVATVRVRASSKNSKVSLSLQKLLGGININAMLKGILEQSVSPPARALLDRAENNKDVPFYSFYKKEGNPIYQTYLVEKLGIDIQVSQKQKWEKRNQESKEIRKRMVSAYLSICKDLNQEPTYGSTEILLGVCDNSIRDFLWNLDEIFHASDCDVDKFIATTVPINTQNTAIKQSSQKKLNSLPQAPVTSPGGVGKLVYGLGHLTSLIQTSSNDCSHLRSSERGRFCIKKSAGQREQRIIDLIIQAAEAGFLRIVKDTEKQLIFRVHTSLAPALTFSYRGAYYDTQIEFYHLERMLNAEDKNDLEQTTKDIASSIYNVGESKQLMFFGL